MIKIAQTFILLQTSYKTRILNWEKFKVLKKLKKLLIQKYLIIKEEALI